MKLMTAIGTKDTPRLFGTDGVRGVYGEYPMTEETVRGLGKAVGRFFQKYRNVRSVLIARDTRFSGPALEKAARSGLSEAGCDVTLVGVLPTPGAAVLCRAHRMGAVVISASHNPAADNGIKVFLETGSKISEGEERQVERLFADRQEFSDELMEENAEDLQGAITEQGWSEEYLAFLEGQATQEMKSWLGTHDIVLDCANGSASEIAPLLFARLSGKPSSKPSSKLPRNGHLVTLAASPDGRNINRDCGALHVERLAKEVVRAHASAGFAFDGDADRVMMVDEKGAVLDGDRVMAILAAAMKKKGMLAKNTMVATVYSNLGLKNFLRSRSCSLEEVSAGDRAVAERMAKKGYVLGGEQSGHVVLMPEHTTGDGLLTVIALLNVVAEERMPLSELHAAFKPVPQVLVNVRVREKREFSAMPAVQSAIAQAERALGDRGRVLVRYSGTENLARVMVEAVSEDAAKGWAQAIAQAVAKEVGSP